MKIYTIGFTNTSAELFFTRLQKAGVKRLVDVRLNNASQLSGFAKKQDLAYFLRTILGIDYVHRTDLAPTKEMLVAYKKHKEGWVEYERRFRELISTRRIDATIPRDLLDDACLLCSEHKPQHCHRRLVAEYLQEKWGDIEVIHL
jgi:uncharacterized protein (DUF488 family)